MTTKTLRVRAAAVLAAAVAAMVLLAGCVGIPTSGAVVTGGEINEDVDLPVGFLPSGPRDGATQQEILLDFVQAATNPQNDYSIARQFLADNIRSEWNPDARVAIRSSGGAPTTVSETELDYTITTSASIDADGRYFEDPELSSQTLEFGFVQQDGEWRINAAEDGIVLSEDNFDVVFTSYALYFFDPSYAFLVPDVRWFPNSSRIASRISAALVRGQADWLAQGVLVSEFPSGTTLGPDGVSVASGIATVDLSDEARDASNVQRERMRQQLSASLADVRTVSSVVITVAGVPLPINDSGTRRATKPPALDANPLVRVEDQFGFVSGLTVEPLQPLSDAVVEINANAAVLSAGQATVAARARNGVYVIRVSGNGPLLIDNRPGLVKPTIDSVGFVWSAQARSTRSITTFSLSGTEHPLDSSTLTPLSGTIVSMDLSRDGSRLLLYLSTPGGPRLVVAGVIRSEDNVPDRLGAFIDLPIDDGLAPIDAAWITDSSVATLSHSGSDAVVTALDLGGPARVIGRVAGGTTIVGGNGGADGIRVLTDQGDLFKPRGNGWQQTGINASFLATQQ